MHHGPVARALEDVLAFARNGVPFHARRAPEDVGNLSAWPMMSKSDINDHPLDRSCDLLSGDQRSGGYLIASGGSLGVPNYFYYSHAEARWACRSIARNFAANGLAAGDTVINYFLPGGMWSSFLLVDRALSLLPVTVLPVGYSRDRRLVKEVIDRFRPNAIAGITTTLVELARECEEQNWPVTIEKVFFAGETLRDTGADLLRAVWGSRMIRSAGYATTDFGPIGWQCLRCDRDDYHVFADVVLEIVDEEIVVTSLRRRAMPLIRYRTGDRGHWLEPQSKAPYGGCGAQFRLLGRVRTPIQIGGCNLYLEDLLEALNDCGFSPEAVQVCLEQSQLGEAILVRSETRLRPETIHLARDAVYRRCPGLANTLPPGDRCRLLRFEEAPVGSLERHARTGKTIPLVDRRGVRL